MRKSVLRMLTASVCLLVLAGGAVVDEKAAPLKVGDAAADHLGMGTDDQPLVLSRFRGRLVCFACVDHHK